MQLTSHFASRRSFVKASSLLISATSVLADRAAASTENPFILGPLPGYSPQLGSLVSEMNWMRMVVLMSVKGMSQDQLDFLLDNKANTIGALLLHLAATEKLYQMNTFDNVSMADLDKSPAFREWAVAMNLGEPARKTVKGHSLDYYLNLLHDGREKTLAEFRRRDDKWLLAVDKDWGWGPTNSYCKWFHVCEHESNHNGQIKLLKARLPGAKPEKG